MKKLLTFLLALTMLLGLCIPAMAAVDNSTVNAAVTDTAKYIYGLTNGKLEVGSVGGEWAVMGLARSGYGVPDKYYQDYYAVLEQYVKDHKGVLHEKKYTEYSRIIVALSAIGKDARNVGGYDLTAPLADYDKTIWQGLNGPIWALIALDTRNYACSARQQYIDRILACQLPDGGWSLNGTGSADPDITGMALQALAKYQSQPKVKTATDAALDCLGKLQDSNGGYSNFGEASSESCVQVIVGLCELGVSLTDSRFVKNGKGLMDNLMSYYTKGGGFKHTVNGGGNNQMATEQGFYALVAVQRATQSKNSLYRMSDAKTISTGTQTGAGLPGKNAAVKQMPVTVPGKTFPDIKGHANQAAIEAMAARTIINGKSDTVFDPNNTMTRAEFATITVKALGLTPKANNQFTDVKSTDWFAAYVGTAYTYGIIKGVSDTKFNPQGTITRQEAAVMVARAAKLCGMDTTMNTGAIRDVLAQFTDYTSSDDWAREGLAFCYQNGILDDSALTIQPKKAILRCEVAQMLYNMLDKAKLL